LFARYESLAPHTVVRPAARLDIGAPEFALARSAVAGSWTCGFRIRPRKIERICPDHLRRKKL